MGTEILIVYFVYGLSFFGMGIAVLLETGRAASRAEALSLSCLAAFGILHGSHEWLEAYLLQALSLGTPLPVWLGWCRLAFLVLSFSFLLLYAAFTLRQIPPNSGNRSWHLTLAWLWGLALVLMALRTYSEFPVPWLDLLDAAARYLLAVPGALLASLALRATAHRARVEHRLPVSSNLRLAALGFAIYSGTQLFVHRLQFYPATFINHEAFLALTGMPVQVIRALMAVLITVGILKALQALEQERHVQLANANQAHLAALEQRDALRRDLLRHVVRTQEDERARIARELHDEIAQLLSAFTLELGALRTRLKRSPNSQLVDRLQNLSHRMSQGLYQLVRDLRPSHLDNLGLVPALNFIFSQDYRPKGLEIVFDVAGNTRRLGELVETVLFRIAQESLTNVVRHARVSEARVELIFNCNRVTMRISDHGCGFDPAGRFLPPRGWGLVGMRERVESVSGQFNLRTEPGQGTLVEVVVPLYDDQGKELVDGPDHALARG